MNQKRFETIMSSLKQEALQIIKISAPVRTGNLQDSVKARDLPNGGFEIYIDTNQAPYAEATTNTWVSPQWNGRKNPNEAWDKEAADNFIRKVKSKLNADKGVK